MDTTGEKVLLLHFVIITDAMFRLFFLVIAYLLAFFAFVFRSVRAVVAKMLSNLSCNKLESGIDLFQIYFKYSSKMNRSTNSNKKDFSSSLIHQATTPRRRRRPRATTTTTTGRRRGTAGRTPSRRSRPC